MNNTNDNQNKEEVTQDNLEIDVDNNSKIKLQAIAVICLCLVVLLLFLFKYFHLNHKKEEQPKNIIEENIGAKEKTFDLVKEKQDEEEVKKDLATLFGIDKFKEQNTNQEATYTPSPITPKIFNKPRVLKSGSSFSVEKSTNTYNQNQFNNIDNEIAKNQELNAYYNQKILEETNKLNALQNNENPSNFNNFNSYAQDNSYSNNSYQISKARINKINPHFLLSKGSFLHCSLNTKIISMLAGNVSCTISNDIYSADGTVLLIDRGSTMFGSFKSGEISDGVNRLFVVWEEIRTPNNLIIPIDSPATDSLGASGMSGYVDHQYLKRFGSAILLSVIDDAINVAINGKRGKGNVDYTENTRENARELANTALQEFIKIKPVLYKNQGEIVSVYVNKDVDFSKVYKLKMKAKQ